MKNKWVRVVVMIAIGFFSYSVGQGMSGIIPNLLAIVGFILVVGGIVEIFRKRKSETVQK